jgi:hypothetical protein
MTPGETPSPFNSQAVVDLTGDDEEANNMQLPSLPKKRAGDFEPGGEPAAKRTMRNVSYEETEAFAVEEPAAEETDVAAILNDMLAMHEGDFPEGDFGHVNGFDLPQPAQTQAAPFDFGDFAFAGAIENDEFRFDADTLPSAGIDGDVLSGFDFTS